MNLDKLHTAYFLGIGGIGMSALARWLNKHGISVHGYDRLRTPLCIELEAEGMTIHYEDTPSLIPTPCDLAVYTPAIPATLNEYIFLQSSSIPLVKRADLLGSITQDFDCIAIAGTHGKTTTASLVAHLLKEAKIPCNAFLGGIAKNFNSNLLVSPNAQWAVAEADEFDRSFLKLFPRISAVTSVDADHLDIYGTADQLLNSFKEFVNQTHADGLSFIKYGLDIQTKHTQQSYHLSNTNADYHTQNLRVEQGIYVFDWVSPQHTCQNLHMSYPGLHNVENAVLALACAHAAGADPELLRDGLMSFQGVQRRFDTRYRSQSCIYIDDYAHHPQEIAATLKSIRHLFPKKQLTLVFQPHLFSRTRDLMDEFAQSLSLADELVLLDIYPAREQAIQGVHSEALRQRCQNKHKQVCSKHQLVDLLASMPLEILVTMGAGDIDQCVHPIEKMLYDQAR